jgi:hypothetical protein
MQRFIALCVLILCLAVTACSTIMEGSQEEILLTTPGAPGSRCYVRNEFFFYVINPPRRFEIERTSKPYNIVCVAPGNRVKTAILPVGFDRASLYNVSNGVAPGVATDLASGALFRYPDEVAIDFTGVKPHPMPLPDYQQMFEANPLMRGMEQFRPGVPALQSDQGTQIMPMEKRDPNEDSDTYGMSLLSPADATGNPTTTTSTTTTTTTTTRPAGASGPNATPTVTGGASTSYGTFKTPAAGTSGSSSTAGPSDSTTSPGNVTFMHRQTFSSSSGGSSVTTVP